MSRVFPRSALLALLSAASVLALPGDAEIAGMVRDLGSTELSVRQAASERILELGLADPTQTLEWIPARHEDPEISAACERIRRRLSRESLYRAAVGEGEDPTLREALEAAQESPSPHTYRALFEAAGDRLPLFAAFLDRALAAPDPEFRKSVFTRQVKRDPSLAARLVPLLADPDPGVRASAVGLFGGPFFKAYADRVVTASKDPAAPVRKKAVEALGRTRDRSFASAVAPLAEDVDMQVQLSALEALSVLGADDELSRIGRLLAEAPAYQVRFKAASVLGNLADRRAIPFLARALEDPIDVVRWGAAESLGRLTGNRWKRGGTGEAAENERDVEAARAWWKAHRPGD